jgi:hypothetical protein
MPLTKASVPHSPDLEALANHPEMNSITSLFNTRSPVSMLAHEFDSTLLVDTPRHVYD